MKIGIDCRFWGITHAGLGRYTRELVLAMVKQEAEYRAQKTESRMQFTLFFQKGEWETDKGLLDDCKIVEVEIPHYSLKEQLLFGRVVDKEKLNLMHFTHFNVPFLTTTPYVVTIHDLIKHFFKGRPVTTRNELVYWLKYGGYRFIIDQAIHRARHILVPSYFVKDQIAVHYPGQESKISVVYEGVSEPYGESTKYQVPSTHKNPSFKSQKSKVIEKYSLNKPFFIYTGSAYPSKDVPTLLKAFKLLTPVGATSTSRLLIACARGHFWQKLAQDVQHLGLQDSVLLPGNVPDDDLVLLYKQAVAFVTPSLMEGFGLPGLEALASGSPVIASEAGSLPEVYGKAAIYFQPGNADDLARKMKAVLEWRSTQRDERIVKGLNQAQPFHWGKAAEETVAVYQNILK